MAHYRVSLDRFDLDFRLDFGRDGESDRVVIGTVRRFRAHGLPARTAPTTCVSDRTKSADFFARIATYAFRFSRASPVCAQRVDIERSQWRSGLEATTTGKIPPLTVTIPPHVF